MCVCFVLVCPLLMAVETKVDDGAELAEFDGGGARVMGAGLGSACERGNVDEVRWLLHRGVEPDKPFEWGMTGLIKAAGRGHVGVVSVLLSEGKKAGTIKLATKVRKAANVDAQAHDGTSALHRAAYNGHTNVVKVLLSAGATVDIKNAEGETPLMAAAFNGHLSCIDYLLGGGAKVNHVAKQRGDTAVLQAATRLKRQCVLRLISAGADVNIATVHGDTALMRVCKRGSLELVDILLDAGADVDPYNVRHKTAIDIARDNKHDDIVERLFPLSEPRPREVESLHPPGWYGHRHPAPEKSRRGRRR